MSEYEERIARAEYVCRCFDEGGTEFLRDVVQAMPMFDQAKTAMNEAVKMRERIDELKKTK